MKILCTGDLHLGRRSSRLPQHLDGRAHSAAGGWARIVDLALAEAVDVVVLSGDLVDRDNRFYEAVGPLEAGLRRLAAAGITTVAVAGNHDFDVLPRLADTFAPDTSASDTSGSDPASAPFRLLGRGGVWERTTIRRGEWVLHLDGWSFPAQYVRESPLAAYDLPVPDDGPVLGLLHADLEQPGSPYAPVLLPELRARPVDFWLLGHVHAPALHEGPGLAPVLYPGSPQALDPGETGAHGVWLLELTAGRRFEARLIPLSTVRYDEVVVDLTDAGDLGEVDARVIEGVRAHAATLEGGDALRCVSCRLRVVGRTPVHRGLAGHLEALALDLELPAGGATGGATAVVEKVEVATHPARDLAELARGKDPVAVLARLLISLEADSAQAAVADAAAAAGAADCERLVRAAERAARDVGRARAYLGLGDPAGTGAPRDRAGEPAGDPAGDPAGAPVVRRALGEQAALLLDLLLAQKEEA
jgi:DNA repair exonuclease SbcCD nuclease subunit